MEETIGRCTCMNTTLKSLNLQSNGFGLQEGKAIADALRKNTTLTSLDLNFNKFRLEAGKAFAGRFEEHHTDFSESSNTSLTFWISDIIIVGADAENGLC
ncbi:hypothetical protein C2G38_2194069 [Gigaspora rosea]|uniref:Uncharacterized protein n=1 Tax=Gigaspora rosea TaxID=44941 RepID=A0A397V177_9GLOM|nr:hypothetical protein C2G38_2194069 [Gigaspora rosea]